MNRTGRRSMSACATRLRSSSFLMGWCSRQRLLCPRRLRTRSSTRAVILDGATPDSVTKTETAFSSPPEVERKHARAFQASVLSSSRPDTAAEAGGPVPSSSEDAPFQPTFSFADRRERRAPLWGRHGGGLHPSCAARWVERCGKTVLAGGCAGLARVDLRSVSYHQLSHRGANDHTVVHHQYSVIAILRHGKLAMALLQSECMESESVA